MKRLTTNQDQRYRSRSPFGRRPSHQQKLHSLVSFLYHFHHVSSYPLKKHGGKASVFEFDGRRTTCGASAGSGRACCTGPGTSPAVRTPLFRSMAATTWGQSQKHQFSLHPWYTISRCSTGTTRGSSSSQRWPSLTPSRSMPGGRAFLKKRVRPY